MTATPLRLRQCVIFVGGKGTRLGDLTELTPKPLLEVGGKAFLSYLLWHAKRFGFEHILLLAGHQHQQVEAFAAEAAVELDLAIEVLVEPAPLGTGGALRWAADRLDARFLLMNGDSLFDVNWLDLVCLADRHPDALVQMALRQEPDGSRYGVVDLDGDTVRTFRARGDAGPGTVNCGIYLMAREVALIAPEQSSLETDVLPDLAGRGCVVGRRYAGFFLDIGVPDAFRLAQEAVPGSVARPAVFFDRDGVLNHDSGYTHRIEDFRWIDGAVAAVKAVNDRGWFAFLVTNQAGVARGYYGEADVQALHAAIQAELRGRGAHLDDFRYCPHHPGGQVARYAVACNWRKPGDGMIRDLLQAWPVDARQSIMIGDKMSDVEAGRAAGLKESILFEGGDPAQLLLPRLDRWSGVHGSGVGLS